jgi:hypothetical protein
VREVSDLSDFTVTVEPIKGRGKQFVAVRLGWQRKALPEIKEVERELSFSKVGRRARLNGTVETVGFGFAPTATPSPPSLVLLPDTIDKARMACPGYDVYALEAEWRRWASTKPAPNNAEAAFIAFCKKYAQAHPLYR